MSPDPLLNAMHAPYFIFVRCAGRYSDADLLHLFGLDAYRPTNAPRRLGNHAIFADDGRWTMIADDWLYTLWHMPSARQAVHQLGHSHDVFSCSVGDADYSFDFVYYRDRRLVRRYVVEDPHYNGGHVVEDVGEPLPGEAAALRERGERGERRTVLAIAHSLGIRTDYTLQDLRVYAPVRPGTP